MYTPADYTQTTRELFSNVCKKPLKIENMLRNLFEISNKETMDNILKKSRAMTANILIGILVILLSKLSETAKIF